MQLLSIYSPCLYIMRKITTVTSYCVACIKAINVLADAPRWALFTNQAVACHLAKATQSSKKRNDLCLHMNREPRVVRSILLY